MHMSEALRTMSSFCNLTPNLLPFYIRPLPGTSRPWGGGTLNPVFQEFPVQLGRHRSCYQGISSHVEKLVSWREN